MTDQRLRELLHERVADVTTTDLTAGAWDDARRVRRRRTTGVLAGVVAAVVAIGGAVVVLADGSGNEPSPAPATRTPDGGPVPTATRAGKYGGADVWWAPSSDEEADLPVLGGTPLPATIDLSEGAPPVPDGVRAVALFQLRGDDVPDGSGGEVVVVAADGTSYTLDVGHLEQIPRSIHRAPVLPGSLAPDGRNAFFVQNGVLAVYDFAAGTWTTIATGSGQADSAEWSDSGHAIRVPEPAFDPQYGLYAPTGERVGTDHTPTFIFRSRGSDGMYAAIRKYGMTKAAASLILDGPVRGPDRSDYSGVDAVVVQQGRATSSVLASTPGASGRWLRCCVVAGWLDSQTVLFESRWEDARILAWRVGTQEVSRVSDVRGWTPGEESYVASFADFSDR